MTRPLHTIEELIGKANEAGKLVLISVNFFRNNSVRACGGASNTAE
jgi:hypothetical protein